MNWWPWSHKPVDPEAEEAPARSRRDLREARERWPEVREVSAQLRHQRRTNSLAQAISDALGGRT